MLNLLKAVHFIFNSKLFIMILLLKSLNLWSESTESSAACHRISITSLASSEVGFFVFYPFFPSFYLFLILSLLWAIQDYLLCSYF
jgi:hypothetical protein